MLENLLKRYSAAVTTITKSPTSRRDFFPMLARGIFASVAVLTLEKDKGSAANPKRRPKMTGMTGPRNARPLQRPLAKSGNRRWNTDSVRQAQPPAQG